MILTLYNLTFANLTLLDSNLDDDFKFRQFDFG
jgi:hypothetical protein